LTLIPIFTTRDNLNIEYCKQVDLPDNKWLADSEEIMAEKLFIYGTLGPGRPNEHVLKAIGGVWENATVRGTLRQEGWGAEMGFPGIDLDENGEEIEGFLFISENLSSHWKALDDFEGEGYERVVAQAKLEDGSMVDAYIYILRAG
jgi:gamma-glutamylcyclotransferase (GGCT)/AIG2-like uncharacterized protein YtfP